MMWPKAYRHESSASVAAAEASEAQVFNHVPAQRTFLKFGRLLIREDVLNGSGPAQTTAATIDAVRLMTGRPWLYWRALRHFGKPVAMRSEASAALLKNNIRLVYPESRTTLKVSNPTDSLGAQRIAHESATRQRIADTPHFRVPGIMASGKTSAGSFFLEELLQGCRPVETSDVSRDFVRQLLEFQKTNAVPARSVKPLENGQSSYQCFLETAAANRIEMPVALADFLKTAHQLGWDEGPWMQSHGDLSRSNILVAGDQHVIVDWEFSAAAPAAADVVRLATQFPGFAGQYIAASANPSAATWFVLGCVHAANSHMKRLDGLSENRHAQKAKVKAAAKFAAIMALAHRHAMIGPKN